MELKNFLKTTEAIIVLGGLFLTVTFGGFWAFATAGAYVFINVPNLWNTVKGWFGY